LTVAEEKDLWLAWKDRGDESAREILIVRHMKIVKYVAGRMAIHVPSSVEMDDLVGWGVLGLLDAVEKYDHTQNIKFTTYASIRIRGAIIDQIRSLDWAPRSLRAMARRVGEARERLRQSRGSEPSYDQIADEIGATAEQVEGTMAQLYSVQMMSLDDYLPDEDSTETRKAEVTSDRSVRTPDQVAQERERVDRIVEAILKLPEQQQKVLHLYYYEELTLKEVGMVLEVSESRVCQVHSAAMKALRKAIKRGE
jgi:RNA polymerase sigma factor for flagellar operon FliA